MDYRSRNLRILDQRFPGLVAEIQARARAPVDLTWFTSRSGHSGASVGSVSLCSAFDPVREAERGAAGLDLADCDYAILTGLGCGYTARAVRQRWPELPLLIVEPDPGLFLALLAGLDLTAILGDGLTSWQFPQVPGAVRLFMSLFPRQNGRLIPHRPFTSLYPDFCQVLEAEVAKYRTKLQINANTLTRFGPLWVRNLSRNLAQLGSCRPLSEVYRQAVGRPAVICAAGPSLSADLPRLAQMRSRFVLIAVDTAATSLRRAGLTPDYLVFLDGQYWNSRHVDEPIDPATTVVTELAGPPRAFRLNPERTLVAQSSTPLSRDFEALVLPAGLTSLGELKSGGSVATSAWELALYLGCPTVFLSGLDLGYPAGQTHVKGSQFEEQAVRTGRRLVPAETRGLRLLAEAGLVRRPANDGGQVLSDPRMDLYREWFEVALKDHPEVAAYNLSPTGVVIQGMRAHGWSVLASLPEASTTAPPAPSPSPWTTPPADLAQSWCQRLDQLLTAGPSLIQLLAESNTADLERRYTALTGPLPLPQLRSSLLGPWEAAWRQFPTTRHRHGLVQAWQTLLDLAQIWKKNLTMSEI